MELTLNSQFDIGLKALLESIYLKYNYDFRHYAPASMKRTVVRAMDRMGWHTLAVLQEKVLQDKESSKICFNRSRSRERNVP